MKYILNAVVFCLLGQIAFAQNNSKAAKFIDDLIAQKNANESLFISKMFAKGNPPPKPIIRNDLFYQDSIGRGVVVDMREVL